MKNVILTGSPVKAPRDIEIFMFTNNGNYMTYPKDEQELICHCFGYTVADIESDAIRHGRSFIMEKIAAEKKVGGCECTEKNPSGR